MGKRKQLSALSADLFSLSQEVKRLRALESSLHQSLGPLSCFSLLPAELVFHILDLVFLSDVTSYDCEATYVRSHYPNSVFCFFVTCKTAHRLREEWCRHLYRKLGGVEQLPDAFSWMSRNWSVILDNCVRPHRIFTFLELGIVLERGYLTRLTNKTLNEDVENFVRTISIKPCGPMTLKYVVNHVLTKSVHLSWSLFRLLVYNHAHTIPRDSWLAVVDHAVEKRSAADVARFLVKCTDPHGAVDRLCTTPANWSAAFWWGLKHGHPQTFINILNKFVEFDEIRCWGDMRQPPEYQSNYLSNLDVFLEHAPQSLLDMPDVVGGTPGRAPLILDNIDEIMVYKHYSRVHLSGYYEPKRTNYIVYERIDECGGRVQVVHFLDTVHYLKQSLVCLKYVDCDFKNNREYRDYVHCLFRVFCGVKLGGMRVGLLKELMKRTDIQKEDLVDLSHRLSIYKYNIPLCRYIDKELAK
jgi:hypothetical protein